MNGYGLFKDFHYPNTLAGGDPAEALGFLWYHDHRDGFTAQNVYKGLAGFYILFDDLDSGDENDANPAALRLPSGKFDVPMVFTDRVFDADGQAFFDLFNLDGILGDKFTVNGVIQPFFPVARRKYRLRLLNAGPLRFYEFVFSNGQPFIQISSDGNLLPHPLVRRSIRLGVAERADVVVDFAGAGSNQIFLLNRLEQRNGKGPTGKLLNPGTPILRFDINRDAADPSRVPDTLRPLPVIDPSAVTRKRLWRFDRTNGAWSINGQLFDPEEVRADPKQGVPEIWTLRNNSGDWTHPIHLHMEEFRILSRNTAPIPPEEGGRKDVVRLGPNEEISLFIQFRDFVGRYPMHCHNVVHEDHSMMLRYDVGT